MSQRGRPIALGVSVAVLVVVAYLIAEDRLGGHEDTHVAVVACGRGIEPGMSRAQAKDSIKRHTTPSLTLYEQAEKWTIATPHRFGARNWFLFVELAEDHVRCVKFRSADNILVHPAAAPADRCS